MRRCPTLTPPPIEKASPSGVPFLARPRRQEIFACFDRCRFLDLL